jgi:hypothetical protein
LQINVDAQKFGTFAEIGAGQEVARSFFHVGRASGTVAKTISAYETAISDDLYSPTQPLCKPRASGPRVRPVNAADTREGIAPETAVCVRRHGGDAIPDTRGKGWMGVRFQDVPGGQTLVIIIHVALWIRKP